MADAVLEGRQGTQDAPAEEEVQEEAAMNRKGKEKWLSLHKT